MEWNEPVNIWFALAEFSAGLFLWAYGLPMIVKPRHLLGRWTDEQSSYLRRADDKEIGSFKRTSATILYALGSLSAARSVASIRTSGIVAFSLGAVSLLVGIKTCLDLVGGK